MKKLKIYLETTVFNFYFDTDRDAHKDTLKLFEQIKEGIFEPYTSAYVVDELLKAHEPKKTNMINLLKKYDIKLLDPSAEAQRLMEIYVAEGVIPQRFSYDGLHIAIGAINELDCIISFNFQHINKLKTKTMTDYINKKEGYIKPLYICVPMEVLENEE